MTNPDIITFTERGSPDEWLKYSMELKESAKTLYRYTFTKTVDFTDYGENKRERPGCSRSYFLIAALSIENALKGVLVARNPELVSTGKLGNKIKTHNLRKLINECGDIELNDDESILIDIFSDAIPYWGRYPIPLEYSSIKNEAIFTLDFHKTFIILVRRLHSIGMEALKNGWDAGNGVANEVIEFYETQDSIDDDFLFGLKGRILFMP